MKQQLVNMALSLAWAGLGIFALVVGFWIVDKVTPSVDIWGEIVREKNVAVGITVAGFVIAVGLIIASVVR